MNSASTSSSSPASSGEGRVPGSPGRPPGTSAARRGRDTRSGRAASSRTAGLRSSAGPARGRCQRPARTRTGADEYMKGLVAFADPIVPGSVRELCPPLPRRGRQDPRRVGHLLPQPGIDLAGRGPRCAPGRRADLRCHAQRPTASEDVSGQSSGYVPSRDRRRGPARGAEHTLNRPEFPEGAGSDRLVTRPAGELRSGLVDFEALADGGDGGLEVAGVGADDQVVAAQGSLDDAGVDNVAGGRAGGERAGGAGPGVVQGLGVAAGQDRDSRAWRLPPRQAWARTGAGTTGTSRRFSRARWRASWPAGAARPGLP